MNCAESNLIETSSWAYAANEILVKEIIMVVIKNTY
jgi:hypothetical protein